MNKLLIGMPPKKPRVRPAAPGISQQPIPELSLPEPSPHSNSLLDHAPIHAAAAFAGVGTSSHSEEEEEDVGGTYVHARSPAPTHASAAPEHTLPCLDDGSARECCATHLYARVAAAPPPSLAPLDLVAASASEPARDCERWVAHEWWRCSLRTEGRPLLSVLRVLPSLCLPTGR